jgi:chromosome segregation ATPase
MDPQQKLEIDKRFLEQNMIIETMRGENSILEQALHDKEMEILRLKDSTQENQQAPKSQSRDASMRERWKHSKAMKSKAREISRLKTDIASINKNFMNLKATTMTVQQAKSEKEKDRLKISDLLRQRSALESQTNNHKTDMFKKEKEQTNQRSEIEKLKQLLEMQKTSNNKQKSEIEKYKELYNNAKANTTPFSDSRIDNMTEATHGMKNTPTDMKTFGGKNIHISNKIDTKPKPTPISSIIAQDKSMKEEIEKKLDDSFEEIPEK